MKILLLPTVIVGLLTLDRCTPGAVYDPAPGELTGEWFINQGRHRILGKDSAVIVELRLRNLSARKLRVQQDLAPVVLAGDTHPAVHWTIVGHAPVSLDSGRTLSLAWKSDERLPPGEYKVQLPENKSVQAMTGSFTVEDRLSPAALRDYYANLVGTLGADSDSLLRQLQTQAKQATAPPSVHLQLAELLESRGETDAAREQYRRFAEKGFGIDSAPAWVRAKIEQP